MRDRDAGRTFRYAALAAGVYLDGNVVGLSVPGLLGIASQGPRTAGQVAILLSAALLPVALVARAGNGIGSAALVTAAAVLAGQCAVVVLDRMGVPGLMLWDYRAPGVVLLLNGFMEAAVMACFALVPATVAAACTAAVLHVRRAVQPVESIPSFRAGWIPPV